MNVLEFMRSYNPMFSQKEYRYIIERPSTKERLHNGVMGHSEQYMKEEVKTAIIRSWWIDKKTKDFIIIVE